MSTELFENFRLFVSAVKDYNIPLQLLRAKSTDCDKLTANQRFCRSDFVDVISSQSEGLGKMAQGIVKIYLGSPFQQISVVCGQLLWTPAIVAFGALKQGLQHQRYEAN